MESQVKLQASEIERINREIEVGTAERGKRLVDQVHFYPPDWIELGTLEFDGRKCGEAFDAGYRRTKADPNLDRI